MSQLQSVGLSPSSPEQELQLAIDANNKLRETLKKIRQAFNERRMVELDTEIANAWLIDTEVEQRLNDALKAIKSEA